MSYLAAIDIGSNAVRLVLAEHRESGEIKIVRKMREPVRLGHDVFSAGEVSEKCLELLIKACRRFQKVIRTQKVDHIKAVATSALREAKNKDFVVKKIRDETGISIQLIDGKEEGNLISKAVAEKVDLKSRVALLIDIGGGSIELTVIDHGQLIESQSFKIGTVRMLELMNSQKLAEHDLPKLLRKEFEPARAMLAAVRGKLEHPLECAIGTGGNFECMGRLRVTLLSRSSIYSSSLSELTLLSDHLTTMTMKERVRFLRLREDRADVIVPALLATIDIMRAAQIDLLMIPHVGLRDGLLADLISKVATSNGHPANGKKPSP